MHSMLRQNQIRLQDIKAYVRTCDRQNELGPEEWAKLEANAFTPGTLVFLLEPAKRPPGLTSFAAKSQQVSQPVASDTFRVKDLSVVVDRVEDKSWVLNVTPSAYELRFLDTLFKEKAMKAILEGIDFNYLIATPRKNLDDAGLKEIRQLANIYGEGGSRRSLSQDPSGPEEPAKAILGFLGVDWSQGGNKPVIELGSVCHLIFAPEGQEESPLRNAIKGSFTPILPNETIGTKSSESQTPAKAQSAESAPVQTPLQSLEGLKPISAKEGSVFAPMDLNKSVSSGGATNEESIFAPVDKSIEEIPPKPIEQNLSASAFAPIDEIASAPKEEDFATQTHPAGSLMTEGQQEHSFNDLPSSKNAPQEIPLEQSEDAIPAWYILTHDLKEMIEVGKQKAAERFVPQEPEEKIDYSNSFLSDYEKGEAGSKALQLAEQKMLEDQEKDAQALIAADADQAIEIEHFDDSLFEGSGAKGTLEANPEAQVITPPQIQDKPLGTKPQSGPGIKAPEVLEESDGNLFEKLTADQNNIAPAATSEPDSQRAKSMSGRPTNLMDMLTAESDVFTTTSAKPGMQDLKDERSATFASGASGQESDNYNDLANALNGLIDSDSIPKAVEPAKSANQDSSAPAPNLFNMDIPHVLSESGTHQSPGGDITPGTDNAPAPGRVNLFDDDEFEDELELESEESFKSDRKATTELASLNTEAELTPHEHFETEDIDENVKATSEVTAIKFRPELTLNQGGHQSEIDSQATSQIDSPELLSTTIPESPFESLASPPSISEPSAFMTEDSSTSSIPESPFKESLVTPPPVIEPEPEPVSDAIVTAPPPAIEPEPEPVSDAIVTAPPPAIEPEPEPVAEAIVTAPPPAIEPESELVSDAIVTAPPPAIEPEPEPVSDAIVTAPPPAIEPEPEPVSDAIVTAPPPAIEPEPEPVSDAIVTAPPPAIEPEPEPVSDAIVTAPPVIEPEPEPVSDAIVTAPPVIEPEPEPVSDAIVTAPPVIEPEPEPVAEAIVTAPPPAIEPEPEPVSDAIVTAPPFTPAVEHDYNEQLSSPNEEDSSTQKAKAPLLKPISKRRSRASARRAQAEPAPQQVEPEIEAVEAEIEIEEMSAPQGPTLEPKLVLSESARFMARLNQRLSEADKKLTSKSDIAKDNYTKHITEHIDKAYLVERERANNSLSLAAKLTRELEGVSSQVKTRIEETSIAATEELNKVIREAEAEVEQVKQELVSTLRYAEHRARSDSDSLQDDSSKKLDNHIQERTQEFSERTEYVCSILNDATNEHITIAEKRFDRFKVRMHEELNNILSSLERNVNSMNEEIDGSWDRAAIKLLANQKEFENTANHLIRNCQLNLESKIKLVYVDQILPKLVDNKAIFRTMLFDMKKNYEEQSDRIITEHLTGLETNIKNAQEELKLVVSNCYSSIEEVGKGQQSGLNELYENTSARMQELTNQVSSKLESSRATLERNQTACNQVADYGKENEDPTLAQERTQTRATLQTVRRDAERRLDYAISNGCENLETKSENLSNSLSSKREEWTSQVKQSSEVGISKVKRAIQDAYQAIEQAKDDYME